MILSASHYKFTTKHPIMRMRFVPPHTFLLSWWCFGVVLTARPDCYAPYYNPNDPENKGCVDGRTLIVRPA